MKTDFKRKIHAWNIDSHLGQEIPCTFLEVNIYHHIHKQTVSGIYAEPDKSSSCPPTSFP